MLRHSWYHELELVGYMVFTVRSKRQWMVVSHFPPFTQIMTLSHEMIPLTFIVGSSQMNLIEIIPHTVANRLISMLILNPIKLAVKINLHNV